VPEPGIINRGAGLGNKLLPALGCPEAGSSDQALGSTRYLLAPLHHGSVDGGSLLGLVGALIAVPVAAAIQLFLTEVVFPSEDTT
jgi:hypothetical protein